MRSRDTRGRRIEEVVQQEDSESTAKRAGEKDLFTDKSTTKLDADSADSDKSKEKAAAFENHPPRNLIKGIKLALNMLNEYYIKGKQSPRQLQLRWWWHERYVRGHRIKLYQDRH